MSIEDNIRYLYPSARIHNIPCYEPYMTYIRNGDKTVEGRVGTPYYTKIHSGDFLRLYNRTMEIWCRAIRTERYPSFEKMLETEGLKKLLPQAKTIEEGVQIYRSFPTFIHKEPRFGAFAIEVKVITNKELEEKIDRVEEEKEAYRMRKKRHLEEKPSSEEKEVADSKKEEGNSHIHKKQRYRADARDDDKKPEHSYRHKDRSHRHREYSQRDNDYSHRHRDSYKSDKHKK